MTPFLSSPCQCAEYRIPYGNNVVPAPDGRMHRASRCDGHVPTPPSFIPPAPRLLNVVCEQHGTALWVTGPTPEALYAAEGCGCDEEVA